jgi:hypothetical protein
MSAEAKKPIQANLTFPYQLKQINKTKLHIRYFLYCTTAVINTPKMC